LPSTSSWVLNEEINTNITNDELDVNVTNESLKVDVTNQVDVNIVNDPLNVNITNDEINTNITNDSLNVDVTNEIDVNITNDILTTENETIGDITDSVSMDPTEDLTVISLLKGLLTVYDEKFDEIINELKKMNEKLEILAG